MSAQEQWWVTKPTKEDQLNAARAVKIDEINAAYVEVVTPLIRDYPQIERDTWWAQEPEATAYLEWEKFGGDTDPPPTPVLDNILLGRNGEDGTETLHDLSLAVLDNAQRFTEAQRLTGKRQRLVKLARAAETLEVLDAISW